MPEAGRDSQPPQRLGNTHHPHGSDWPSIREAGENRLRFESDEPMLGAGSYGQRERMHVLTHRQRKQAPNAD